jgi:hypothetical protein
MLMVRLKRNVVIVIAFAGLAALLFFQYRAQATLRQRDEQLQRLRERMARLEDDVARRSATHPIGLPPDELEAYLSLGYKEFDATPGSGHRRFRDQPRHPSQSGELIEAYLQRHPELPSDQRMTLEFHAAQLFAMGGMNERAITHLDRVRLATGTAGNRNPTADATKAFLLLDREGLLAARRRMADGEAAQIADYLIERFGESYADITRWGPICSTIRVAEGASADHRAAAEQLAKAFGLPVRGAHGAPTEGGIPGDCIWLEVRPMGGTPDVEGYIILHANKSTVITATSEQRLEAAVKRFFESSRQRNGKREAPFGLATSFELAR